LRRPLPDTLGESKSTIGEQIEVFGDLASVDAKIIPVEEAVPIAR